MAGVDDLLAGSADRWAKAERRAEGIADKGLDQAVKRYFTTYFPTGMVLLFVVGAGVGLLLFQGEWAASLSYLFAGIALAYLGAIAGGIVYNAKVIGPAVEMGRINVLMSLQPHEQKQLRREILGKIPATPEHLVVKRAAAVRERKGLATQLILIIPILELQFLVQLLNSRNSTWWWLIVLVGTAVTLAIAVPIREFRALGRFLTDTQQMLD
ncbi:hypothetical protein [Pseudarthrobacter chlorophenolicus]|uniref:hypothetical protein n=1 Tax=Pseudarthrobacter chlorophenolicus TaxID=85085 RepID=UPI0005F286ED|nr:hypothetical protein [Pseudarthrobacter chlorophenolicus]